MVVFKKAAGGGYEERLHLRHCIIKYQGAPFGVVCHALLLALKKPCAVKKCKTVFISGKMSRYPVHDNADAGIVQNVNKFGKFVGIAVARGGSIVTRHLIAP